jgi:hypothetical protein
VDEQLLAPGLYLSQHADVTQLLQIH